MENIDLEKLQEFIDGDDEIKDSEEIENTLDFIDNQLTTVKSQTKEIKTIEDVEKQETTIEDLTQVALNQLNKVDKNTDEIYDLFYKNILLGKDRTDVSKQSLVESQRIKVELINALTGLANAKAKLEIAKSKVSTGNVGIFVDTMNQNQAGINLHNLWEETK